MLSAIHCCINFVIKQLFCWQCCNINFMHKIGFIQQEKKTTFIYAWKWGMEFSRKYGLRWFDRSACWCPAVSTPKDRGKRRGKTLCCILPYRLNPACVCEFSAKVEVGIIFYGPLFALRCCYFLLPHTVIGINRLTKLKVIRAAAPIRLKIML